MERKVVKIIKPDYSILKKTRVAVYCRVSTAHLEQMNSLENQLQELNLIAIDRIGCYN